MVRLNETNFNPLTAAGALRALIDFTLSNARRFYSSMENPLAGKGLKVQNYTILIVQIPRDNYFNFEERD